MPEVHLVVLGQVPEYDTGERIELKWDEKTTLGMAEDVNIPSQFHAFAFNRTSMYVHPSAAFMLSHISEVQQGGVMATSTRPQDHEAIFALRLSHALILNTLDLRLKYAPSTASSEQLEECRKDFVEIWGYPPPI